jgi:hypothetical protein
MVSNTVKAGVFAVLGVALAMQAHAEIFVMEASGALKEFSSGGALLNGNVLSNPTQPFAVDGDYIYSVAATGVGALGKYSFSGALVTPIASGWANPTGVAVAGNEVFVTRALGTVGAYTTSGQTINAALIAGLNYPMGMVASGASLFVFNTSTISEYSTSGQLIKSSVLPGVSQIESIAVSGDDIYVLHGQGDHTVGHYKTTGVVVNASLLTLPALVSTVARVAVDGGNLYVSSGATLNQFKVAEYTTDGALVNASLIGGLFDPVGLQVSAVPEPSTALAMLAGLGTLSLARNRKRRPAGAKQTAR